MIDPKSSFEKIYGKRDDAEDIPEWTKAYCAFFEGWDAGYQYRTEEFSLLKDKRDLMDFQRSGY